MPLNTCCDGGALVGPEDWLPDAAYDYYSDPQLPRWGCNQLACRACGAAVRSVLGYRIARAGIDLAALHTGEDWASAVARGELAPAKRRLYVCRCTGISVDRAKAPDRPDDWEQELGEDPPPWRCAGHPRVQLPFAVDGVAWGDDTAEALTRDFLAGTLAATIPAALAWPPSAWLCRCEALLAHTPLAQTIARVCKAGLEDASAFVRARAADFFFHRPGAAGAERAAWVLSEARAFFDGVPDPFRANRPADLRFQDVVAARFIARLATPEELALVKSLIVRGTTPGDLLARGLAAVEPTWFVATLGAILVRAPSEPVVARLIAASAATEGVDDAVVARAVSGLAAFVPAALVRKYAEAFLRGAARTAAIAALAGR